MVAHNHENTVSSMFVEYNNENKRRGKTIIVIESSQPIATINVLTQIQCNSVYFSTFISSFSLPFRYLFSLCLTCDSLFSSTFSLINRCMDEEYYIFIHIRWLNGYSIIFYAIYIFFWNIEISCFFLSFNFVYV